MELRPCPACKRHVANEPHCPFCSEALPAPEVARYPTARLSRAAVFAGAALAGGCWTSTSPPPASPAPDPQQQVQHQQETQPTDPQPTDPRAATGTIRGVVLSNNGTPLMRVTVHADLTESERKNMTMTTDDKGEFVFENLTPGRYIVYVPGRGDPRQPPRKQLRLARGATERVELVVLPYVPSAIKAPYGAPPARRRVV